MKGLCVWLLGACSALTAMAALPSPMNTPGDSRIRTVRYSPEAVVSVPVRRGTVTHIVLAEDEAIVNQPAMGKGADCTRETDTWCVIGSGRDIFIKPKTGATTNTMALVTTQRRHTFEFEVISDTGGRPVMRLSILSPLPPPPPPPLLLTRSSPVVVPTAPQMSARELVENRLRAEPQVRNSNYSVAVGESSEDIVPVLVFDDGMQTYFAFPNNRPVPTVFQTAPDMSEEMVNVRMQDDKLVADRVARRFVLRLGESVVSIINEDFDLDGVPPVGGTTVPGVARALRAPVPANVTGATR